MPFSDSELILNADGSIYHLNLLPNDIASTIILVGDPERVSEVSKYFDHIELKKQKREFCTHTGYLNKKRLTVLSTGIGVNNIDIVLNELDALINIDFSSRTIKETQTSLSLIRIGTSGAIQKEIGIDTYVLSEYAIGLDGLLHFYAKERVEAQEITTFLSRHLEWHSNGIFPYVVACNKNLKKEFGISDIGLGMTVTNAGFYAPQGRELRLTGKLNDFYAKLTAFRYHDKVITNLEMETAAIYGLSQLLGHCAISLNAILANRALGTFSSQPQKTINRLIQITLERLANQSFIF